ncbi:ABC-F family ATP-binding cassette domain-containing protein [uncultured Alistipes sp.]|uniref:ABC-F family ATP-binding cassette domain-containing protein n=1 Tax=uncultured Alistipes sp. TaxID=538949 RepID=UPI0025E49D41|nr:ABC-F family ATP-binding cassette domain-containing protein [uncultured Alistipes sp.]
MSIIASGISYRHSHRPTLFENVTFIVADGAKVSLIGPNGAGKSTLLQLLAGRLTPATGSIVTSSHPYFIPQQTVPDGRNVAGLLGAADKLRALRAIYAGSVDPADFETLDDDWTIEERCRAALDEWGLRRVGPDTPAAAQGGGERTKAMLAGWSLHDPEIVLLDEPTNHLDRTARTQLYDHIGRTHATLVVVSHDIALLDLLHTTCELTAAGIRRYGGNYDFYRARRDTEEQALTDRIEAEQSALRAARKQAQEVRERQERRAAQGERSKSNAGQARILVNARGAQAQNSAARLRDRHAAIIDRTTERLAELRARQERRSELKIDFDDAALHTGKQLIRAEGLNYGYADGTPLWSRPIDLEIRSGDRVHVAGDNGSGKTTLVRRLLGELAPTAGRVTRSPFTSVYLDQEYRALDTSVSVLEMAERHNTHHLADHEIKIRLDRALFPHTTWDNPCRTLSGGERMRLMLCCLMLSNHVPDLFVLDEPTNNLDIGSLAILTDTLRNYRGTLLVVSHDDRFVREIGATHTVELPLAPSEERPRRTAGFATLQRRSNSARPPS